MSEEVSRSALDERLLSLARLSPVEIGERVGLEPAVVAARLSELLVSRDWLSELQRERLLLVELEGLKDSVLARVRELEDGEVSDYVAVVNVALRSLRLVGERLDSRRRLVEEDLGRVSRSQARLFGEAFDLALQHILVSLPLAEGVDGAFVDGVVEEGLRLAAAQLESRVGSE